MNDRNTVQHAPFNTIGSPLSNFCALREPIADWEHPGIAYPTVEHAYQAMKVDDPAIRHGIAALVRNLNQSMWDAAPGLQLDMRLGRLAKLDAPRLDADGQKRWDGRKLQVMERLLDLKFGDPLFSGFLSGTRPRPIVEAARWDSFWGTGHDGNGHNHLGRLLLRIRSALPL